MAQQQNNGNTAETIIGTYEKVAGWVLPVAVTVLTGSLMVMWNYVEKLEERVFVLQEQAVKRPELEKMEARITENVRMEIKGLSEKMEFVVRYIVSKDKKEE